MSVVMMRVGGAPRYWVVAGLLLASLAGAISPFTLRFGAEGAVTIPMTLTAADYTDPLGTTAWGEQISYIVGQTAYHLGNVYRCTLACVGVEPGVAAGWGDYWRLVDDDRFFQLGYRTDAREGVDVDDGIEPYYDVLFPQFVLPGSAALYFRADEPYEGLRQDFRPPSDTAIWEIELVGMYADAEVTLQWSLRNGSLDGRPLVLLDTQTNTVLVANMAVTNSVVLTRFRTALLAVVYGSANKPPVPRGDKIAMLSSESPLAIPVADLLANDYDVDPADVLSVVDVSSPYLNAPTGKGTSDYGTTELAGSAITYTLPAGGLPPECNGTVYFTYTVSDSHPTDPRTAVATVAVAVAETVLAVPTPATVPVYPGTTVTASYTLRHAEALYSLRLKFVLPNYAMPEDLRFWHGVAGSYSDDDDDTADPTVDVGWGDDEQWDTDDDTGVVWLDFGTAIPESGTTFSFDIEVPAIGAADNALTCEAFYRVVEDQADPFTQVMPALAFPIAYRVTFASAGHGTIVGEALQYLEPGAPSALVRAVEDPGYHFLYWTVNGIQVSTANPVIIVGGSADMTVVAVFESNHDPADPDGHFDLIYRDQLNPGPRLIWDLTSGAYTGTVGADYGLTLNLVHDERGALRATGHLQGTVGGQALDLALNRGTGSVIGKAGVVRARLSLRGSNATSSASLTLDLVLDGRTLVGTAKGSVTHTEGGRARLAAVPCVLAGLPENMDGTYLLSLDLVLNATRRTITGTALLSLPSTSADPRTVALVVKGRQHGTQAQLQLTGDRNANPAFGAVRFRLTIEPYTDGTAAIRALSGGAFGQDLRWP